MPPPTNRDLFIVLVDLKTTSRLELLDTLHTIKLYEILSSSKSLCNKIYLVNSTHTSNSHDYKGIQIFDVGQDGSPTIPELPTETGESDFVEAIRVAATDLESDATSSNSSKMYFYAKLTANIANNHCLCFCIIINQSVNVMKVIQYLAKIYALVCNKLS